MLRSNASAAANYSDDTRHFGDFGAKLIRVSIVSKPIKQENYFHKFILSL